MVRVARQSNTSMLFPEFTDLSAVSHDLLVAVQHAHTILSWFENLPEREVPPAWMWPFPDETGEWFEEIRIAREQERNKGNDEIVDMDSNAWSPDDE